MNIEKRINQLEKLAGYVKGRVPGTQLVRALGEGCINWCLSLGLMQDPKAHFYGGTIDECIGKAEEFYNKE